MRMSREKLLPIDKGNNMTTTTSLKLELFPTLLLRLISAPRHAERIEAKFRDDTINGNISRDATLLYCM